MPSLLHRLIARAPQRLQRDTLELELDDGRRIEVLRVRDPRARRLKLSVDERGARLTLPVRASMVSGDRFLHEHRDWLATQLERHQPPDAAATALAPGHTSQLPLRGEQVPLSWHAGRYIRIARDDAGIHVQRPARASDAALRRALRAFYEAEARADIGRWLPAYLPGLPRTPRQLRLKVMSSQWGSLAPDGTLALDLALVLARPSAFEYVLVHELCHLLQANHSPAFWREVEARFPRWREEKTYFHAEGRQLKASLRSLLST
ncbi:M48 family metallopeptidase [Pseudoxanthomonas daejeonensis]|uniref:YgjP family zinc-dependent metalloprotease n=1 Tax=Pseudoxanthomonas daejeonensis TaxID=266062 RepID=UPI001F543349|nr:SprT family zinc-dependent metalloprotease [Pseudoxanthomonas daejeonensis]UNK58865.1 M48 family metallopeptidase [Pseudoxanthomonas daejeonensis]